MSLCDCSRLLTCVSTGTLRSNPIATLPTMLTLNLRLKERYVAIVLHYLQSPQNPNPNLPKIVSADSECIVVGEQPVGVGMVFQPDSTGALHVKSLAVGGSAERTGQIQVQPQICTTWKSLFCSHLDGSCSFLRLTSQCFANSFSALCRVSMQLGICGRVF